MRLPGGRRAQPGVSTGQSVLAWRLGYAEVSKTTNPKSSLALTAGLFF